MDRAHLSARRTARNPASNPAASDLEAWPSNPCVLIAHSAPTRAPALAGERAKRGLPFVHAMEGSPYVQTR